jgi:hypothetical protein
LFDGISEPYPHATWVVVDTTGVIPIKVSLDKDVTMRSSLICVIAVPLLIPPGTLLGADTVVKSFAAAVPPALKDVELGVGGVLNGQLVDTAGNPVVAVTLSVISGDTEIKITTNKHGRFSVGHLKGGFCVIKVDDASYGCRLWHQGTAPPNAIDSIAMVQEGDVARGQHNFPPRKRLHRLTSEQRGALFLAGFTGTALALALTQDAS